VRHDGTGITSRRAALAASFGIAVLMASDAAHAQLFGPLFGPNYGTQQRWIDPYGTHERAIEPSFGTRHRRVEPARPYYRKPERKPVETAKRDPVVKPPQGPLLIAISIGNQRVTLYTSGVPIAHSGVSTGVPGHPTPTGIFSVIGKEKFHRSNLYSNAPMPFMQRITWSGVAIHQGVLPGYPASHGCIRVAESFAHYLWGTTRMGARVIITHDEVTPFEIAHAKLFAPRSSQEQDEADDASSATRPLKVAESDDPVRRTDAPKPAGSDVSEPAASGMKLKDSLDAPIPVSSVDKREPLRPAAKGDGASKISSTPSAATDAAASGPAAANNVEKGGDAAARELKDVPRMSDPVSVFISRKTGRLYVRQGFEPLFDTAVTIRDAETPLGTHLYTATELTPDQTAMRWVAVTLSNHGDRAIATEPEPRRTAKKRDHASPEHHVPVPPAAKLAALAALDRVDIPKDVADRISDLLSPGASLIISDYPISSETGKYTDFIILTK